MKNVLGGFSGNVVVTNAKTYSKSKTNTTSKMNTNTKTKTNDIPFQNDSDHQDRPVCPIHEMEQTKVVRPKSSDQRGQTIVVTPKLKWSHHSDQTGVVTPKGSHQRRHRSGHTTKVVTPKW